MASISKMTPWGEMIQFVQNLHSAGLTPEDIKLINKQSGLASDMVTALRPKPEPTRRLPDWYVMPHIRLKWALQANTEHQWGFVKSDFPAAPEGPTKFWLLEINLPGKGKKAGLQRTVDEFYELIDLPRGYVKQHARDFRTDSDCLRLAPGYKHRRGIRWVELDLDAYPGMSSTQALMQSKLDGVQLIGAGAFAAVWQFPEWISSWEPLDLPGLQFRKNDGEEWDSVPTLCRWSGTDEFGLMPHPAKRGYSDSVSSSIRECKN